MLVDINLPRWVPFDSFNLNEDVPGSIAAPDTAMDYPWKHFIGGHMGRIGTRGDMVLYQQYVNDIIANVKKALAKVDPTPFFAKYGDNEWAAVKEYQAAQVTYASAPVIKKYTGVLAAADVYTASTTFVSSNRSGWTSVRIRRSTPDLVANAPLRPALRGSADGALRADGPRLAAIEVRGRHRIPVIRCTGARCLVQDTGAAASLNAQPNSVPVPSAQEFGPAGLGNHQDPVTTSHRPRREGDDTRRETRCDGSRL